MEEEIKLTAAEKAMTNLDSKNDLTPANVENCSDNVGVVRSPLRRRAAKSSGLNSLKEPVRVGVESYPDSEANLNIPNDYNMISSQD